MKPLLRILLAAAVALVAAGCAEDNPTTAVGSPDASAGGDAATPAISYSSVGVSPSTRTYAITVENLTPATGPGASQPFSPPVIATHRPSVRMFTPGRRASDELAQIAEDAINGPMVHFLENSRAVNQVVVGDGVILPGAEAHYEIMTDAGARHLSMAFMLVNTNDGFSGIDAMALPYRGEKVLYLRAWDAGSEENTELKSDIPGPCCGSPGQGTPTHDRILPHPGILGVGDLDPATWGWSGPVAKVTVRRIEPTYRVTVENLTPATVAGGSQPFSPPLVATHRGGATLFHVGGFASPGLIRIAEEGDASVLAADLMDRRLVSDVVTGAAPILPGASDSFEITAADGARFLSLAFMLVNTNDGFSGANRVRLPAGGSATWMLGSYDAGSEVNTERAGDIPGPCCGGHDSGPDESKPIAGHPGIQGTGDLAVADYGWTDPVARLTVERIK